MPNNIDLLLDQLTVDSDYRHSHANTEPSILNGLFGNLTFVPWTGFRKIVDDAIVAVEAFNQDDLEEVNKSLHQARKFISRAKKHHKQSLEIERARKSRYYEENKTKVENRCSHSRSVQLAQHDEQGSTDIVTPGHSPKAKKAKPNPSNELEMDVNSYGNRPQKKKSKKDPWYERKTVTNSTSISTLHHHVMEALRDFLDLMYPGHFIRLEQIPLSCGNLVDGASDSMLFKFMEKLILDVGTETQSNAETNHARTDGTNSSVHPVDSQGRTQSTSDDNATAPVQGLSVSANRGPGIAPLETTNASGEITNALRVPAQAGNSSNDAVLHQVLRRSERIQNISRTSRVCHSLDPAAEEISVSIPLRPVIPLNQTPDQCLFRNTVEKTSKVPVCCLEFKGPTLDLSGLISSQSSAAPPRTSNDVGPPGSMPTSSNAEAEPTNMNNMEVAMTEVGGNGPSVDSEDGMYISGATAKDVAEHYNLIFSESMSHAKGQGEESRLVVLPIAQVICQAILSKTGCVFLTNHQMSFALRVVEDSEAEEFRAKVFVTGAIPSNKEPGQVAALLGFTMFCLKMDTDTDDEALLDPMRRLVMGFSYFAYNSDVDDTTLDPDWCPGDHISSEDVSEGSSQSGARTRALHGEISRTETVAPAGEGSLSVPSGEHTHLCQALNAVCAGVANDYHATREDDTRTDISSGSDSSHSVRSLGESRFVNGHAPTSVVRNIGKQHRSRMDEKLKNMFASSEGTVAAGGSGVVIKTVWDGVQAAAKMWNGQNREGFLNLRREIRNYNRIESKCRFVLGSSVPNFLLGWDRPDMPSVYRKELILVTEFVGSEVLMNENNEVCLISEDSIFVANKNEQHNICEAALCSLRKLHENGFIHGDVALRNMRASRRNSENGWKVWWLDLGNALEVRPTAYSPYFNMEIRQCQALFNQLP